MRTETYNSLKSKVKYWSRRYRCVLFQLYCQDMEIIKSLARQFMIMQSLWRMRGVFPLATYNRGASTTICCSSVQHNIYSLQTHSQYMF